LSSRLGLQSPRTGSDMVLRLTGQHYNRLSRDTGHSSVTIRSDYRLSESHEVGSRFTAARRENGATNPPANV